MANSLEESLDLHRSLLETLLADLTKELNPGDCRLVQSLLDKVNTYVEEQSRYANCQQIDKKLGRLTIAPCDFNAPFTLAPREDCTLRKIIAQALFYKDHGERRYEFGGKMITVEELTQRVDRLAPGSFVDSMKLCLRKGFSLSASQIGVIEKIEQENKAEQAGERVYLRAHRDVKERIPRILRFAIDGTLNSLGSDSINEGVRAFKESLERDPEGFRARLYDKADRSSKLGSRYRTAFETLKEFVGKIDPASYRFVGFTYAEPAPKSLTD